MQALEAAARRGQQIKLPGLRSRNDEKSLAADMRISSEFVDNVMATGSSLSNAKPVITQAMLDAAVVQALPADYQVDTATMHPANMVGSYHAWKIKSSYPIPGRMINDDYRRRFLAMYANQQDKALEPSRRQRELEAEVSVAVTERFEDHRLPSEVEKLLGQIEGVLADKDKAVEEVSRRSRVYEGTAEQTEFFKLMRARKIRQVEEMFLKGEVNVAVVEPGTAATGLLRATSLGLLTLVRMFCKGGADCDYATPRGVSALHCAWDSWLKVKQGHPLKKTKLLISRDIIMVLLEFGADVNKPTGTGLTALHMAATFGHDDIVAMLLRFGADRNRRDKAGRTPLDIARHNQHAGAAGLLANWGTIDKYMKLEEFRKEWGSALENRIGVERRFMGRDARSGDKAETDESTRAVGAAVSMVDEPARAGTNALLQAREGIMRLAGPGGRDPLANKSAEELIDALRLQEHLRERRKLAAEEERVANPMHDPTTVLNVAEYDLHADALRAIDPAADAEAVGDSAGANRLRLAGVVKQNKMLPWGRGPAIKPEEEDAAEEMDELSRAIAEEEEAEHAAELAAELRDARARARARDHQEGIAAEAAAAGGSGDAAPTGGKSKVIRKDSTRDLTKSLYDQPVSGGGKTGKSNKSGDDTPNLKATAVPSQLDGSDPLLLASASSRNILLASHRAAGLTPRPGSAGPSGQGGKEDARPSSTGKPRIGRGSKVGAGERDDNNPDDEDEGKPVRTGPPADTAAVNALMQAQTKKMQRRQWHDEMKKKERDRNKWEKEEVARLVANRTGVYTDSTERPAARPTADDPMNLGKAVAAEAVVDEDEVKAIVAGADMTEDQIMATAGVHVAGQTTDAVPGQPAPEDDDDRHTVDSDGNLIAERVKDVLGHEDDDEIGHMSREELKAYRWRKKMLKYYEGMDKVQPSDGTTVDRRRRGVARGLTNDTPELMQEYTKTYQEAVVTRRPAVASTLLRPSRFRVDTRVTVDAETVVAKGAAFETLMAGAVSSPGQMNEALGLKYAAKNKTGPLGDQPDKPAPSRPGVDAMSLSQHAQASVHDPVVVAEMDRALMGEEGNLRRAYLEKWAPPASQQVSFAHRAYNSAAVLPATSGKRGDAEQRGSGRRVGRGGQGIAGFGQPSAPSEELWGDKEIRVRKSMIDAKAALALEAQQAHLMKLAMDDGLDKVKGAAEGPTTKLERRAAIWAEQDKEKERKKKLDKAPGPETYGQGLMSSWPLHKAGPIVLEPGQSLLAMSTINVLAKSRAEYDAAVERNSSVYAKYAQLKTQKALSTAKKTEALINAAGGYGANVDVTLEPEEKFDPKKYKNVRMKPRAAKKITEADKAENAARKAEHASIPVLSSGAAETLNFMTRKPPARPMFDPNHEDDLRANRDPHFAVFKGTQDPWKTQKFDYNRPLDAYDVG